MFASRNIRGTNVPCIAFYIICVICIIIYGYIIRHANIRDHLARRLYHHPICQDIDGWSISHFLFFGLLGVFFPGQPLQFLLIGIGWEVIETVIGQNSLEWSGRRFKLVGDQDDDGEYTGNDDAFWYGKESDIIVDILGYCIGSAWASRYWPATKLPKCAP